MKKEEINDLIEACKKGDPKAFNAIYSNYGSMLYGIAMRYAKDTSEAEDIVQESFIKIFKKIISFENKGSFEGWLKRILVNTAINKCVKNQSLKESFVMDEIEIPKEADVYDHLGTQELLNVIAMLPDGYKAVFNMYVIDGYNHREIGEILGISEGTSKSQLSKAKTMLRKMLVASGISSGLTT